jgi:alginate O-acetyltransferase complex protein AlgJ
MNKKIISVLSVSVFALGIIAPQTASFLTGQIFSVDTSENRNLTPFPSTDLSNWRTFPSQFDSFYNDHLPFRSFFRDLWQKINLYCFNSINSEDVLLGKNEGDYSSSWLFYKNPNDGNSGVEDVQGLSSFSDQFISDAVTRMSSNISSAKANGANLTYFVSPNKENIYRDKLPDSIRIFSEKDRVDKFVEYIKEFKSEIPLIYPKNELLSTNETDQTYFKDDTHWNYLGGFVGFKAYMESTFPSFSEFSHDVQYFTGNTGDLISMSGIKNLFEDKKTPSVTYLPQNSPVVEEFANDGTVKITSCSNAIFHKTFLIVGDSFRNLMIPYFSRVFEKAIFIHRDVYTSDYFSKYNPDEVVIQFVERYANQIATFSL